MSADESRAGSEPERSVPKRYYIDEDTTDEFLDGRLPSYESGDTPEQQRARVDKLLAEEKAGKRTLPTVPPISEG